MMDNAQVISNIGGLKVPSAGNEFSVTRVSVRAGVNCIINALHLCNINALHLCIINALHLSLGSVADVNHGVPNCVNLLLTHSIFPSGQWQTLITVFRILVDSDEERVHACSANALTRLGQVVSFLHEMHHEATACHVMSDLVQVGFASVAL